MDPTLALIDQSLSIYLVPLIASAQVFDLHLPVAADSDSDSGPVQVSGRTAIQVELPVLMEVY